MTPEHLYAIPCTTALISLNGERMAGEIAVAKQIQAMGLVADPALSPEFRRTGKDRNLKLFLEPLFRGYVFAGIPDEDLDAAIRVDGAFKARLKIIGGQRSSAVRLLSRLSHECLKSEKIVEIGDKRAMIDFTTGQEVELLSGPFVGMLGHFRQRVRASHDDYEHLEIEIEGIAGRVKIDPLDVKAVA